MNKKDNRFDLWCHAATELIRYGPDRKAVAKELRGHMEDAYDAAICRGLTEEEAINQTMDAMGKAHEIAPLLAAIHKPFWGYYLRISRIVAIVLLCVSLIPIWNFIKELQFQDTPDHWGFDIYSPDSYGSDTGRTLLHLSQPNLSFSSDGNHFVITDAALITTTLTGNIGERTTLHIRMKQITPLPWTVQEQYYGFFSVCAWFFARDNLGNIYPGDVHIIESLDGLHSGVGVQSSFFSYNHELFIMNFPEEAQWVDICYKRDGREFSLRIYLGGGDCT